MRRVMTHLFDLDVVMMMGVTDIDDKIINRANEVTSSSHVTSRCPMESEKG